MTVLGVFVVASNVVMEEVPAIFNVALAPCFKTPVPEKAVATVKLFELINVMAVMVMLAIEKVPVRVWLLVEKVWAPVLAVNVPLLVIPPMNVGVMAAFSVQLAPALIVTKPVNVLDGLEAEVNVMEPLLPLPTVVVPETESVNAPTDKEHPSGIDRFKQVAAALTVTVNPFWRYTLSLEDGTDAPAVPVGLEAQVDVAFQFPVTTAYRSALHTFE